MISRARRAGARTAGAWALGLALCTCAGTGRAAPWVQTTSLPDAYQLHSLVYASGYLYQAGGASETSGVNDGTNVFYAQVHTNGTIGNWNSATPLPTPIAYHAGVAANGFIYVIGGTHYDPDVGLTISSNVYYAKINSDASLGSWHSANPLPGGRQFPSASAWNNRIYVIGGSDENSNIRDTVYSATIQTDGSLSAWVVQAPFPVAIYTQASVANGFLYVLGGAVDNGSVTVNTVYYSKINVDGTLAGWNQTAPLPQPECCFGAVVVNGWVFTVGGLSGTGYPTASFYGAAVNGDGSLTSWTSGTPLPLPLLEHAVAVSDSYIFVSGGFNFDLNQRGVYSMALPAPPGAPGLAAGSVTNGTCPVQLASAPNTGFGLQASTNLTAWMPLGWGFTGTNGTLLLKDTNAAHFPHRFYRAYWPLP